MNKTVPKKTSDQKLHKPRFKHRDLISIHKNNHGRKRACPDRSNPHRKSSELRKYHKPSKKT